MNWIFAPPSRKIRAPTPGADLGGGSLTLSLTGKWGPNSGVGDQNFFGGGPHFIVMMNKKVVNLIFGPPRQEQIYIERGGGEGWLTLFLSGKWVPNSGVGAQILVS